MTKKEIIEILLEIASHDLLVNNDLAYDHLNECINELQGSESE